MTGSKNGQCFWQLWTVPQFEQAAIMKPALLLVTFQQVVQGQMAVIASESRVIRPKNSFALGKRSDHELQSSISLAEELHRQAQGS